MKVVEDKETELQRLRECCNKLMATHVSHQMKKIKEIEQKLQTCMQARLAREKVSKCHSHCTVSTLNHCRRREPRRGGQW